MNYNFMNCLSPNAAISGTKLKGADQRAMQARARLKTEDDRQGAFPMALGRSWEDRMVDYKAIDKVEKRKLRGGANFTPTDAF